MKRTETYVNICTEKRTKETERKNIYGEQEGRKEDDIHHPLTTSNVHLKILKIIKLFLISIIFQMKKLVDVISTRVHLK